jgi:hypothetical protein
MPSRITANRKWKFPACSLLALALIASAPAVNGQTDSLKGLKAVFSGAVAQMQRKTPAGPNQGEAAPTNWHFSPEGKLWGQFAGLNTWVDDTGVWTVEGKKLCTQWQNWEKGKKHCYLITVRGDTSTIGGKTYSPLAASGSEGLFQGAFTLEK